MFTQKMITQKRFTFISQKYGVYQTAVNDDTDPIIADSNQAGRCFDYLELARTGADLFESINRLDEDWRMLVLKDEVPHSEEFEDEVASLYRAWLQTSERLLIGFRCIEADFASRGFSREEHNRLVKAVREVQAMQTDCPPSDAIAALCDKAIDDFRSGATHAVAGG